MELLIQTLVFGLLIGGVYALLASGLTLMFGVLHVINIAQGAYVILAAYVAWELWRRLGMDPLLSIVVTAPLLGLVGVLSHRLLIRRIRQSFVTMSVLVTFGLAIALEGLMGLIWTGNFRAATPPYFSASFQVGSAVLPATYVYGSVLAVLVLALLYALLYGTRFGRAVRAAAQNWTVAQLVGVDVERVATLAYGLGAATAGVGGSILSILYPFAPGSHYEWIARLLGIIVLGGMGSLPGAAVGACLLGLVEAFTASYLTIRWATVVFYVGILAVLLVRPQGLLGTRVRGDVQA